jgi:hypothetical protein
VSENPPLSDHERELERKLDHALKQVRKLTYGLVLALVAVLGVGVNSVVYPNNVARHINHEWCDLIGGLDNSYQRTPPPTAAGRQFAAQIHELRRRLGC